MTNLSLKFKQFKQANITFDDYETIEGDIRYYITPDGKFPSMTSILSILDDGGLDEWRERVGDEEADRICQEASDRGNALHDYSEDYLNNRLDRKDLKGPAKILFNRSKRFLDEIELVVGTEIALYNKTLRYAGRSDCIGVIKDKLNIIDHKNSRRKLDINKPYVRRKIFSYMLQCTGYAIALEEQKGLVATHGRLIIGVYETSKSEVIDFPIDKYLKGQFYIVINAYYGDRELAKQSDYYRI